MIGAVKNTGKTEKFVGAVILATLAVIAVCIFRIQERISPAVFPLATGAPSRSDASIAPESKTGTPILSIPPGMAALGPAEVFTPADLSDKINGKAELYLAAGFVELKSQRFNVAGETDLWVEIFVYDMDAPRNAYSVYSAQRREGAEPSGVATDAYKTANALFLVHGKHYVELVGSSDGDKMGEVLNRLADRFVRENQVVLEKIKERDLFPETGREPGSITLSSTDGFGFDRLDNLFTARYRFDGVEVTAFLSLRKDPLEARELAKAYRDFLLAFDGKTMGPDGHRLDAMRVDIMDTVELIFTQGPYIAGVHEAEDRDLAERLAVDLMNRIKGLTDGS